MRCQRLPDGGIGPPLRTRTLRLVRCAPGLLLFLFAVSAATVHASNWVDLGVAEYPAGRKDSREPVVRYRWSERSLRPDEHRLGVRIHAEERQRIESELVRIRRATRFENRPGGFRWDPGAECGAQARTNRELGWRCIHAIMSRVSEPGMTAVNERFSSQIRSRRLDTVQAVSLIVSFIQDIPYDKVEDRMFGVLPPALVVHERRGDCDSKSLLGHMMLAAIGIESHLMISDAHRHAMLAIRVPGPGLERRIGGQRFLVTEMTTRHPVGRIDPKLMSPDDWFTVQVVAPVGRAGPEAGGASTANRTGDPAPAHAPPGWSADEVRGFVDRIVVALVSLLRALIAAVSGLLA